MTRDSFNHKPYRVNLMELANGKVYPSPSPATSVGNKLYSKNPNHPGSLGIGMGEAMEFVKDRIQNTKDNVEFLVSMNG